MTLACSKLAKLFNKSSPDTWGEAKVGRGLLIIGIKFEDSSFCSQVTKGPANDGGVYKKNLERVPMAAREIVNKSLPDNGILIDSMFYPAKGRYELHFV
jgi:hypothetical protein